MVSLSTTTSRRRIKKNLNVGNRTKANFSRHKAAKGALERSEARSKIGVPYESCHHHFQPYADFWAEEALRVLLPSLFYKQSPNKDMNPHTGNRGFSMPPLLYCVPHRARRGK